ncbi:tetratricopeptide repeat protein [Altererythrobacter aquaemixtae]|uniref:Tetratricopeptide repeat protein n=2 Tax=Pontixanthobacter aquaemixtae TaxID=1958940 RepID=A0A844ZQ60_9SPHN|nr:tetratricopeptide repeat protein [Pontixanthobacter aquaemixtae]
MRDALVQYPQEAPLWNSAGGMLLRLGDAAEAVEHFAQAAELQPANMEFAINGAIALSAANRHRDAIAELDRFAEQGRTSAVYCSTRGTAERGLGNPKEAAFWYDLAISLEPGRIKALHGRARVALDRGEETALQRFDRALNLNNGDADLWLGKAQALDVQGNQSGAREIAEALVKQAPGWTEGLRFLAQLRLAEGEEDFTSHYGDAAKAVPQDPNIFAEWISVLAGLDFNERAASLASRAQAIFPHINHFTLQEAINAGAMGDNDRAERLFAKLERDDPERWLHEARHRIRRGEFDRADTLLGQIIEADPWSISAWALRGVVWRMIGDARSDWLHGGDKLVDLVPLHDADRILPKVIPLLHGLHDGSPLPLGQSLRGGSQTRGILFDRTEPEFAELHDAIAASVEDYRSKLPPADPTHPLLRHRDNAWSLAGSWSVRLSGGGDFHTAHIHPQGIVSSALYLEMPAPKPGDTDKAGWLEVGRPAADLALDLEPIRIIEPKPVHMALFPSTLYHGTRPFAEGQRMTVAFDVTLTQGTPR